MSYSNSIKSLLDIQDPNIIFEENCVKEGTYKGKTCKYISGKLTYDPTHCEKCGVKNVDYTIFKNSTQVSRITLPITGVNPTYLLFKKATLNAGYVSVIKELFPQAKIIIDRFHLVQLINRSMNKCRINIMNQLKTSSHDNMRKYRRLKRYWKLLLKNRAKLSSVEYKYYPLFGQRLETSIIEEILDYDPALKANYELYQELLKAMTNKDFEALSSCLANPVHL